MNLTVITNNISKLINFCYPLKSGAIFYDEDSENFELESAYIPYIFKLDVDCFDRIFNHLSLKDLYSFGQTCQAMKRVTGKYFQQNYELAEKIISNEGIYTMYSDHEDMINERIQIPNFNKYINCISYYYEEMEPFHYIHAHSNDFKSINGINLVCLTIDSAKVKCLQPILSKIDVVKVNQCALSGEFYKIFLKHCTNLKKLYVQHDLGYIIMKNAKWMNQNYPQLEYLHLTPQYPFKIHGLYNFFEQNANLRYFSTNSRCLWECRNQLLASRLQLDRLDIHISDHYYFNLIDMQLVCCLLNKLHEQKFYAHLDLYVTRIDQQFCDQLTSICGLNRLFIKQFRECFSLPRLINLKELVLDGQISKRDINNLSKGLWNLKYLSIRIVTSDDLIPFMRHSIKLTTIYAYLNDGILNLIKLNREREKLKEACNVTIYVPSNIFLATIWTTKNGNNELSLVKMKRGESSEDN